MKQRRIAVAVALGALLLSGCASQRVYEGLYEGMQARNDALKSPAEQVAPGRSPSYAEYEAERKRPRD